MYVKGKVCLFCFFANTRSMLKCISRWNFPSLLHHNEIPYMLVLLIYWKHRPRMFPRPWTPSAMLRQQQQYIQSNRPGQLTSKRKLLLITSMQANGQTGRMNGRFKKNKKSIFSHHGHCFPKIYEWKNMAALLC